MNEKRLKVLAFDLGASSGRAILGILDQKKLHIEEIYRFPNYGILIDESLYWDILYLFKEIKNGVKTYVDTYGKQLSSIGIDTWGVDFVLLDKDEELIGPVYHYRDKRTSGIMKEMIQRVPKEEIFNQTGIQFLDINTSNQLYAMVKRNSSRLKITESFLMLPDYFNFLLSGVKGSERSDASTSQLFNPFKKQWEYNLIKQLKLNPKWFQKIIKGGTILGAIKKDIAHEIQISEETKIIAPLTHDTGSAYAATPVDMEKFSMGEYGILSSGTWALLGVELTEPIINEKALKYNFTNEGGFNGTIRFLKNITGMWLIQECKKIWNKNEKNLSWEDIEEKAKQAEPFQFYINPDSQIFLNPDNMVREIQKFCEKTKQAIPKSVGEISRTIFESLAFRYKQVTNMVEDIIGKQLKILHIIGGGGKNLFLNQLSANILNLPVIAGPSEATAIGNLLVQAYALGKVKDLQDLRLIVRNSFKIRKFFPQTEKKERFQHAYQTYLSKTKRF
jgi:rhamnulokinase